VSYRKQKHNSYEARAEKFKEERSDSCKSEAEESKSPHYPVADAEAGARHVSLHEIGRGKKKASPELERRGAIQRQWENGGRRGRNEGKTLQQSKGGHGDLRSASCVWGRDDRCHGGLQTVSWLKGGGVYNAESKSRFGHVLRAQPRRALQLRSWNRTRYAARRKWAKGERKERTPIKKQPTGGQESHEICIRKAALI